MFCLVLVCSGTWAYLFIIRRMVIILRHPGLCFPLPLSAGLGVTFISLKMPMTGRERPPPCMAVAQLPYVWQDTPKEPILGGKLANLWCSTYTQVVCWSSGTSPKYLTCFRGIGEGPGPHLISWSMGNILSHVNMVDQWHILSVVKFNSWAEMRLMYTSLVCPSVLKLGRENTCFLLMVVSPVSRTQGSLR